MTTHPDDSPEDSFEPLVSKDSEKENPLIKKQNLEFKRLLKVLPFQIFMLVADADGITESKEVVQFRDLIQQRGKNCSNIYTRRIFHHAIEMAVLVTISSYHNSI